MFRSETGWSGLIAEQPTADHYKKALTEKDLFLLVFTVKCKYMGGD